MQADTSKHNLTEDVLSFLYGGALVALAMSLLTKLGLITGQTAGLAVLLSYVSGLPFGLVFFAINLPFLVLGWMQLGPVFVVKSAIAVGLVSILSELFHLLIQFEHLNPVLGALLAGAAAGGGLLAFFRHGASLGGVGVLGLWLQDRFAIQAGWMQLGFDIVLFSVAFFLLDLQLVALSLAGAVIVNLIVGINHRKDRYLGR